MRTGLIIIAFMFTSVVLRAEKYLSVEQARKLAFPNATRFEEQVLRFSAEQRKAIEKKSGVPVKVEGNKVTFAYEGARLAGVLFVDHALIKETFLGFINGIVIGLIVGVISYLWKGSYTLGVVVAIAMVLNMVAAGLSGVLVPYTLRALRIDPALASSIIMTTVTDVAGFFFFLGLAALARG